jgi:hypothetical protein
MAQKRVSLDAATVAAQAKNKHQQAGIPTGEDDLRSPGSYSSSAVNLRRADWKFLRRVAEARAERNGGRPSVSKVVETLIDANRKALEAEVG